MQQIRAEEISSLIKSQIESFEARLEQAETGTIISVGDGVARVHGLENCMAGEMLELPGGVYAVALNLEEDNVGIAIFGGESTIKEGDTVKRTGRILQVPTGMGVCGRVINAIGLPLDGKGDIDATEHRVVETLSLIHI